jgi:hypothetical protein
MALAVPPSGLSIEFSRTGSISEANYGTDLSPYNGVGEKIIPPGMNAITLVSSVIGGNLVYKANDGNIYQFGMSPNVQYSLFLLIPQPTNPVAIPAQIIGGTVTDWQGLTATNNVTDLKYYGY